MLVVAGVHVGALPWGGRDGAAHPHVGTHALKTPIGYYSGTRTLLSSTEMLTAGHCTEAGGQVNLAIGVSFDPEISFAGIDKSPSIGACLNATCIRGTAVPHPKYDDYSAFPGTCDAGVVALGKKVVLSGYGALPPLGLLDYLATGEARQSRQFLAVGCGLQGVLLPFAFDDYARCRRWTSLTEVNSTFTGGPLFYGTTNMVGAIVSWGRPPCNGVD